ncbi:hypothetical protein Clacol_006490 [Clathrus columnatus]|uniref:Uncharacterized protein n=1 Tax=Clathrus columnatus TaxID=1419009 RepID=A0AAV5AHU1_9AGAM|nr:hypothetical protein Clacol_006490 [Clathrus columnatus]
MTSLKLITQLLGEQFKSAIFKSFLEQVAFSANIPIPNPEIKAYPDAVYFNYYTLGISFMFIPTTNQKTMTDLDYDEHILDGIDIYNSSDKEKSPYTTFPLLPFRIESSEDSELTTNSTGQDIVRALGEPGRKGGGSGPLSGSISIWCEWGSKGIMVEFGGDNARGPQAWERGKDARWKLHNL